MKYYLLNFYQLVKKQYLLILGLYIGLYAILFITTMGLGVNPIFFNTILGSPPIINNLQVLWIIFQISCHTYIVFIYLTYEQDSSFEYIILRESNKKVITKKIITIGIMTIFLRIIIFSITYSFFYKIITFPGNSFIYNLLIYIAVTMIVSIVVICKNKWNIK